MVILGFNLIEGNLQGRGYVMNSAETYHIVQSDYSKLVHRHTAVLEHRSTSVGDRYHLADRHCSDCLDLRYPAAGLL